MTNRRSYQSDVESLLIGSGLGSWEGGLRSPLTTAAAIPTNKSPAIIQKAHFSPATKASATSGLTASKLGSTPRAPMVATTTVVAVSYTHLTLPTSDLV